MPVVDFTRAEALQREGRLAEAAQQWVAGLQIDPLHEPAYLALADALLELKLFQPASIACRQALVIFPQSVGAHHKLAAAYRALGQLNPAREVLQSLCDSNPRDAGTRFLLAGVLADLGSTEDAARHLRKALALQPRFPEANNNLALLLRAAGQTQEAAVHLRKAVAIRPQYAAAWNNLGNLCGELSRIDEAVRCYDKALAIDPNYAEAHTNRALLSLLQGKFEEGWQEYEWRWKQPGVGVRTQPKPEWDGSPIAGKTILLHSEQGCGDTIQFIRYARLLHSQGARILLHCQESLRTLLEAMPELSGVFSGQSVPNFDVHAPLMSLPRLLGSIPSYTSYLRPTPELGLPLELGSCTKFRVGLVWSGNPNHRNDRNRSLPLHLFSDLGVEGAQFFSFQVVRTEGDADFLRNNGIIDLAPHLSDYAATARCLENLDLLITVDTSIAHLAGALGRPVWTLLPACNDWRWLLEREDSPWYPSMRLFRQEKLRDWKPQITRIGVELEREIDANKIILRKS